MKEVVVGILVSIACAIIVGESISSLSFLAHDVVFSLINGAMNVSRFLGYDVCIHRRHALYSLLLLQRGSSESIEHSVDSQRKQMKLD